jgi:hypothetical protein
MPFRSIDPIKSIMSIKSTFCASAFAAGIELKKARAEKRTEISLWMPHLWNVSLQRKRKVGSETDWAFLHLIDRSPLMKVADMERPREGVIVLGATQRSTLRSMIFYNSLKDVRLLAQTVH